MKTRVQRLCPFLTESAVSLAASALFLAVAAAYVAVPQPASPCEPAATKTAAPQIYAHRGGRKWAPENTLAAFKKSVDAGFGIELDIHRCKTGELVVIHDEELARTTNGTGLVKDKTLAELRQLSAGKWFGPQFGEEKIPLLSEVLEVVGGKVLLNIEIKNTPIAYPGIDDALVQMLSQYKWPDQIIISSFDHEILQKVHKKAPQYKVGFLDSAIPYDVADYAHKVGATAWHPDFGDVRLDAVQSAHKAGIAVNAWTLNKEHEWQGATAMGLDGIVTDDPVGLSAYLKQQAK